MTRILFAQAPDVAAVPADFTGFGQEQAGQGAQQGGLAAAVVTLEVQQFATAKGETEVAKQYPVATHATQCMDLQLGLVSGV